MKLSEFVLCLAMLKTQLHLSDVALTWLLKFIVNILPKPNKCPSSLYKLKKFFNTVEENELKKHFYCSNCNCLSSNTDHDPNHDESVENEEILSGLNSCTCDVNEKSNYFIEIPLEFQLKSFFNRSGFYNKLRNIISLRNNDENIFKDIYSGSIYKTLSRMCEFTSNFYITFMWYTDGVQIFKSSKFSIWAFVLVILELSYEQRYKLENIILLGLWFGEKKPQPNLFLEPFKKSLRHLYKGIEVYVKDINQTVTLRGLITCGTCDLPAKALFLSMNQYNGRFGCQMCVQEGKTVCRTRVYQYEGFPKLRSEEETLTHAQQAYDIQNPVCGVKGPSIMSQICNKFITSTAVDVMHCVFEGVVKRLMELWFQSKYSNEQFSLSNFVEIVDSKLSSIKPPAFIARRPRSIAEHIKHWKASEFKSWFFYYSLPILENLMSKEYFDHYKYLVLGIYTLCQEEISGEQINLAEKLIHEFVSRFKELYDLRYMTCNIHSLTHLPTVVRRLGPLWATSCFPLEDLNGQIKKFVHSSKEPHLQIVNNLSMYVKLFILKDNWLRKNSDAFNFCMQLRFPKKRLKLRLLEHDIYIVGKALKIKTSEIQSILSKYNLQGKNVFYFKKLYKNKILFTSEVGQNHNKKTESYFVRYHDGVNVCEGKILHYIRVTNCNCNQICSCMSKNYAIINQFDRTQPFTVNVEEETLSFISKCSISSTTIAVDINNLYNVCYRIPTECENVCFIINPVNLIEFE